MKTKTTTRKMNAKQIFAAICTFALLVTFSIHYRRSNESKSSDLKINSTEEMAIENKIPTDSAKTKTSANQSAAINSQTKPTGLVGVLSVKGEVRNRPKRTLINDPSLGKVIEIRYPDGTTLYEPADEEVVVDGNGGVQ